MMKTVLKGLNLAELEKFVLELGEKRFRAQQLYTWMYKRNVDDFQQMTDISQTFRDRLQEIAEINAVWQEQVQISPREQTRKYLLRLQDGAMIESVLMFIDNRVTLCISTQVGCPVDCKFCATGLMGLKRNLTAGEIIDQVLYAQRESGAKISNVVVMGMGEPLLVYDSLMHALDILSSDSGQNIAKRHIVVSTSGVIPAMQRFIREGRKYRLAISLSATTDEVRNRIIPINRKWPIADLMQVARQYIRSSRELMTFEYVLIAGVNDSVEDARRLCSLLRGMRVKVNLIPYNETVQGFDRPANDQVEAFYRELLPLRAPVTVRWSKGVDIDAGCGQLWTKASASGAVASDQ